MDKKETILLLIAILLAFRLGFQISYTQQESSPQTEEILWCGEKYAH